MLDIKRYLKSIGVTQSDLASKLGVSRPTLDAYIDQYESNGKIEKERYNIIFSRLFADDSIGRTEFDIRLRSIEHLLERDRRLNVEDLDPRDADIISKIHLAMLNDMEKGDADIKIFEFILLLLRNYRIDLALREYARCIADLNLKLNEEMNDIDKKYYSFYYGYLSQLENGEPPMNQEVFEAYLQKKHNIQEEKEQLLRKTKKNIRAKLDELIKKAQEELERDGVEVTENAVIGRVLNMSSNELLKNKC